jgi:SnoaL-like domain
MSAIDRLLAKQEIYEILIQYCRGIDRLDEELVRGCYQPDAVDNHGLYSGSVDHFVSNAFARQRKLVTACHYLQNVTIEIVGEAALAETYAIAVERGRTTDGSLLDNIVGLRYVDRFERREGGPWLIARRTVVIDWTRAEPVDEGWLADQDFTRGTRDRLDLVYRELTLLQPAHSQ